MTERRRENRLFVEVPGSYRTAADPARDIIFGQISTNGCAISNVASTIAVGDVIELSLGPIPPITAIVRWRDGTRAGVEFDEPLEGIIVDHFAAVCGGELRR